MSIAGIYSSRGDSYQILIAFDWAIYVLTDPSFKWIEIDSILYTVDDVVVGKANGDIICCQCKKNQTDFKSWSIADLNDELSKAVTLIASTNNSQVRFYSRDSFGNIAKLREYALTQPTASNYEKNLNKGNKKTNLQLAAIIDKQSQGLSTYEFLNRLRFETTTDIDKLESLLRERMRFCVSSSEKAYDAIMNRLQQLWSRSNNNDLTTSPQYRLTKQDLLSVVHGSGSMLAPSVELSEVIGTFNNVSAIGRSWKRHIAGKYIKRTITHEIMSAIDLGIRSILLTGLPGSGKTCVILEVQEILEKRAQNSAYLVPIYIQAREFADLATVQERQALGFPEQWVEQAARIAEERRVVVVIDSLDVLSIAREHSILSYFLSQIDRLLVIPNVTVVTACREFDRHYDNRISEREWECEISCKLLSWDLDILPLLNDLGISTANIDATTRELIRIPRELSLFVDLALKEGSFNVVTSEALAQRYLNAIVKDNNNLGSEAMCAIETIADEMLKSRSLSVPHQRFSATDKIYRELRSLNVLQETQENNIAFGHQTLLDALVINKAARQNISLREFIDILPPVPFVRPSIRSYVAYLSTSDRNKLRKEFRLVMMGNSAFHIRRLVAESFAEQIPQDDDWPLVRDLYVKHREIFNIIYKYAVLVEWHHFWLKHFIPLLKYQQNNGGLIAHAHKLSIWLNDDPNGVISFWHDVLLLKHENINNLIVQIGVYLSDIQKVSLGFVKPLLEKLLTMPRSEHSFLGHILAKCMEVEVIDDFWLWDYIAGEVDKEDVANYQIDKKLHCASHEFGDSTNEFLTKRMIKSEKLLGLSIKSIEQWSQNRSDVYGKTHTGYRHGFLQDTSYMDMRYQDDYKHVDKLRLLLDSVQVAILNHADNETIWWQSNRDSLCDNKEGALLYFALIACTRNPQQNIDKIEYMLCNKGLLEFDLAYEISLLICSSFTYLNNSQQENAIATILNIYSDQYNYKEENTWMLKKRVLLLSAIPCYLRSPIVQRLIDKFEGKIEIIDRKPEEMILGGTVSAPFSYKEFLHSSNNGVIKLLKHYERYERDYDEKLVGGKSEVAWQLREAASRNPMRFLNLLSTRWHDIDVLFRDNIMDGVSNHLRHRYGNLQINEPWSPVEEPEGEALATSILEEIERHSDHWKNNYSTSNALLACAHVITDTNSASRLVFRAISFAQSDDECIADEESEDLLSAGINLPSGQVAEALMISANKFIENTIALPELLLPAIIRFAMHDNPAVRALILLHLPYLLYENQSVGWKIFERAMTKSSGLWKIAERCLYYSYRKNFSQVEKMLGRLENEGNESEKVVLGKIFSLAALSKLVDHEAWIQKLKDINSVSAWRGAASVWTHAGNIQYNREQCLRGLEVGLEHENPHAATIAGKMERIFHNNKTIISIPINIIRLCFDALEQETSDKKERFTWFSNWLVEIALHDPDLALMATERYLGYVKRANIIIYDHRNHFGKLLTRLFAEAEENYEIDNGELIIRVVNLQDTLLSLGVDSVYAWLKAAERP